jgi:hypothetical protein
LLNKITKGLCLMCVSEAEQRGESPNESWLVSKRPPLCQFHKLQSKKIKSKVVKSKDEPYKESDIFKNIWESRPRNSFVTGKTLPDTWNARAWYFSHILPKGKAKYPMFKFYEKNIQLMTFQEHETWEYKKYLIKDDELWQGVFELEQELKEEYEQHKQDYADGKCEYFKS